MTDQQREYCRKYYQAHKAERNAAHKAYVDSNREKIREYQRAYMKRRRGKEKTNGKD